MKTVQPKAAAPASGNKSSFFKKGGDASLNNETPFFSKTTAAAIQTKLTVGQPNDKYEKEADSVADKAVQRMEEPDKIQTKPLTQTPAITPFVQKKCANCEKEEALQRKEDKKDEPLQKKGINGEKEEKVQRKEEEKEKPVQRKCANCEKEEALQKKGTDGTAPASIENRLASTQGKGAPLPSQVRGNMENSIGADFSKVRVHTDSHAVQMNQQLHAQAFTHGNDVYFNSGKYNTNSKQGQHLLAHELTHTVQQSGNVSRSIQRKPGDVPGVQRFAFLAPLVGIGLRYAAGRLISWGIDKLMEEDDGDTVDMGYFILKTLLAIPIDMMGMATFAPPTIIANHIKAFAMLAKLSQQNPDTAAAFGIVFGDQIQNGVEINIRYGKLASKKGVRVRYNLTTGFYEMDAQFMEMTHPAFNMEGKEENTYLVLGVDNITGSLYGGIALLPRGVDVTAPDKASAELAIDEEALTQLVFGNDYPIEKFTRVIYLNTMAGGILQFQLAGYYDIGNGQKLVGGFALFNEVFAWSGTLHLKVNGLEEKEMPLERDIHSKLRGILPDIDLNKSWNFNGIDASLHASYINGLLDIRGTAFYIPKDPNGRIRYAEATLVVTTKERAWEEVREQLPISEEEKEAISLPDLAETGEELTIAGWGTIALSIIKREDGSDVVSGKASVILDPDGHLTVAGSITVEEMYTLMDATGTDWQPIHPSLVKTFGPYMIYVPGVPVGLYFRGNGGLYYKYIFGPLTLHDITIAGIYSTNPAINKELSVSARLNLSAELNGKLNMTAKAAVRAGLKVPYLGFNLTSVELTVDGIASLKTYLDIASTFGVRETKQPGAAGGKTPRAFIKGALQLAGELSLALTGKVDFSVLGGNVADPTINRNWPIANAGLTVDFDYNIGDKLTKENLAKIVKFRKSAFDRSKFVEGVLKDKTPKEKKTNDSKFTDEKTKETTEGSKDPIPIPEHTVTPTAIKDDFKMGNEWHYLEIVVGKPHEDVTLKMASGTPKDLADKIRAERDRTVQVLKVATDADKKKELEQKIADLDDLQQSTTRLIFRAMQLGLDPGHADANSVPGFRSLGFQIAAFGKRYGVSDLGGAAVTPTPTPGTTTPSGDLGDGSFDHPIPIRWVKRGYHSPIALTPKPSGWQGIKPPPADEITADVKGKTRLEVPTRQKKSFDEATEETREGKTVKVVYIGVDPQYDSQNILKNNKRLRRQKSSKERSTSKKMVTLLSNYNYDWTATDADHALDLGWGGPDKLVNLWPMYRDMNQRYANAIYKQPVQYINNGNVTTSTPLALEGKWFTISSIGDV
jgi:hypothetical protein